MKTIASIVCCAAVAALAQAGPVQPCDLQALLPQVYPLLSLPAYDQCQKDAGYAFFPFTQMPTDDQINKMCASPSCQQLLEKVVELKLPACSIDNVTGNLQDTVAAYADQCLPKA